MTKKPTRRAEAHPGVFPYETVKGTRYRYQFDAPLKADGARNVKTKRGFLTEDEAWQAMQDAKRELRVNGYIEPSDETLEEYFARWMRDTQAGRRASTNHNYTRAWGFFPAHFRTIKLRKLTPVNVRMVYAQIAGTYAPSTCRFARTILVMVLKAAHRERLIPFNPADGVPLPVSRDAEAEAAFDPKNVWSIEETNEFLAATSDHPSHALWRLLLDSGLRIGEALALTWDDVDLAERKVRVLRTITLNEAGREVMGMHPKTASSRRELRIQSDTVAHLSTYKTQQKARRLQCGPLWLDRNLIFDAGDGSLMAKGKAGRDFKSAVEATTAVRPLTLHGCRHTMAVTWLQMGRSPASVAARLGHKSAAFTLNVYARVTAQWQMDDVEAVEALRNAQQPGKGVPPAETGGTLIAWPE